MPTLFYIHDPMCSWSYGFKPTLKQLLADLPGNIQVKRVLGGLATDSDQAIDRFGKVFVKNFWRDAVFHQRCDQGHQLMPIEIDAGHVITSLSSQ